MATMTKRDGGSMPGNGHESVVDKAQDTASQVAGVARERITEKVTERVTERADAQRDRAASGLGTVAQAIRQTGDTLGEEAGLPSSVTNFVGRAAEGVERLGEYFDGKDLGEIVSDVERFARREPALFLGGAFVLGLMGARFLKSSARRSHGAMAGRGYAGYAPDALAVRDPVRTSPIVGIGGTSSASGSMGKK